MRKFSYDYPRPALTVDTVLFTYFKDKLHSLLIQRGQEPFMGMWAYPGGFVDEGETAEQAAVRELWEETGVHSIQLEQLFTDTNPNRDPRGWIISVVFYALAHPGVEIKPGDDARLVEWHPVHQPPTLVFGHELFLRKALERFRHQLLFQVFGREMLPEDFELKDLYKLYLQLINVPEQVEKLVKRLIDYNILIQIGSKWHFEKGRYEAVLKTGFLQ